jgi:hypothetical protein
MLSPEKHKEKNRIVLENGEYYSVIGKSKIKINKAVGQNIQKLLTLQDKVLTRLPERKDLVLLVSMLNCRKSVSWAVGAKTLRDLVDHNLPRIPNGEIVDKMDDHFFEDIDGKMEMLRQIQISLDRGQYPVIWNKENIFPLTRQLNQGEFPKVVHMFEPKHQLTDLERLSLINRLSLEDLTQMGFVHTFVVLGVDQETGMVHCFHKEGPRPSQKMEVIELSHIFTLEDFHLSKTKDYLTILEQPNQQFFL